MRSHILDLYSEFLLVSPGQTSATLMSEMLNKDLSHDQITRALTEYPYGSRDLWHTVKKTVREYETVDGVIIIDDTIAEKEHSSETDTINYHFDHCSGRQVKGFNIITCLYYNQKVAIPVGFDVVKKDQIVIDPKTNREKRISKVSKNEIFRDLVKSTINNNIKYKYVIADTWYASAQNMKFIHDDCKKDYIFPLKSNRKIALTKAEQKRGNYVELSALQLEPGSVKTIFIEGVSHPVRILVEVYVNEGGSIAYLYLVTSDLNANYQDIISNYQKRWKIEEYHKSLKQNAALTKSPTRTPVTQTNHIFSSLERTRP